MLALLYSRQIEKFLGSGGFLLSHSQILLRRNKAARFQPLFRPAPINPTPTADLDRRNAAAGYELKAEPVR